MVYLLRAVVPVNLIQTANYMVHVAYMNTERLKQLQLQLIVAGMNKMYGMIYVTILYLVIYLFHIKIFFSVLK